MGNSCQTIKNIKGKVLIFPVQPQKSTVSAEIAVKEVFERWKQSDRTFLSLGELINEAFLLTGKSVSCEQLGDAADLLYAAYL
jgi:hypothetical protein